MSGGMTTFLSDSLVLVTVMFASSNDNLIDYVWPFFIQEWKVVMQLTQ